jgi:taspase (threonine aspartase 1)
MLVSRNARDRYIRWREDLKRAEQHGGNMTPASSADSTAGEEASLEYEEKVRAQQRRDHTQAILNGTWNEGQPDSPVSSPQGSPSKDFLQPCPSLRQSPSPLADKVVPHNPRVRDRSPQSPSQAKRARHGSSQQSEERRAHFLLAHSAGTDGYKSAPNVSMTRTEALVLEHARTGSDGNMSPSNEALNSDTVVSLIDDSYFPLPGSLGLCHEGTAELPSKLFTQAENEESVLDEDAITDTVGAIAIDMYGQIAAGASSGGIGMKHRGRVGPAALVGIGTAIIPADDRDPESISVAAVTSGTGEHMATTMASQKCAERLYFNTRRGHGGADIEATEEEAIESFVQADFMGHPGVRNSNSTGAIGVMAVKKTPYGYFLHFAHNTDSFALASMHSNENNAKCVMSRIGDHGSIVRGGRKIRVD